MFAYAITHCLFIILLILFIKNMCDNKTIVYLIIVNLFFEFILSAILFFYTYSVGLKIYCNLGSINIIPSLEGKDIILIYDSTTFGFQSMLLVIIIPFLIFLTHYFEDDFNTKNTIVVSSIFSQLAFIFFFTYDLLSITCLWGFISMLSFFLVHYLSTTLNNTKYNIKFFFISLVGDFFFLIALFFIRIVFETTDLSVIIKNSYKINNLFIYYPSKIYFELIHIFIYISFFLKSSQLIFLPWILYSTENTLHITEQVHSIIQTIIFFYIFYRFKDVLTISEEFKYIFFFYSFITIITATFLSFFQDDGKKLLACSAASQLSYTILCIIIDFKNESLILLFFVFCNKVFIFFWSGFVMYKNSGASGLKLCNNIKLSIFEKMGLILYIINLTVSLVYVNWQIRVLFINELIFDSYMNTFLGLEILKISWLFNSLYLVRLCILLFSLIYKRKNYIKTLNIKINLFLKDEVNIEHYKFLFVFLLVIYIISYIMNFLIIFFR